MNVQTKMTHEIGKKWLADLTKFLDLREIHSYLKIISLPTYTVKLD